MKCLAMIVAFSLYFPSLSAQQGFTLVSTLPVKMSDDFSVDQFGSLYLIYRNELLKLDNVGKEIHSFSNPILGEIHQVDVLNPLNPYVYYKDANRLVVLDNRLNENSSLNFSDFNFWDVQFISLSDQENVWFYDQATDKLYRFNIPQKKQTNASLNITQLIGEENEPEGMESTIDNVYLNVPPKGIYVFDAVGSFLRTIPLTELHDYDVYGKTLYGLKGGKVVLYDLETGRIVPVLFNETALRSIHFNGEALFLYDGSSIKIYKADKSSPKGK